MKNILSLNDTKKYQNRMLIVWGILTSCSFLYAVFFQSSWALPQSILLPIAENIPAIHCPMEKAMNYEGDDKKEITLQTSYLYHIYGFTVFYFLVTGPAYLIWWSCQLRKFIQKNTTLQTPKHYNKSKNSKKLFFYSLFAAVIFVMLPMYYIVYVGSCDVIFSSLNASYKPGVLKYSLVPWLCTLFVSIIMYFFSITYLLSKKEN